MSDKCFYCKRVGELRVGADEPPLYENIYVCDMHWSILKNPSIALPFLRGSMTMNMRGSEDPGILKKQMNDFMSIISSWKPAPNKD